MAYAPLTKIPQQFFDNLGNPLVSGTLYAYLAGTSTPTNMFSDNAGTVAGTSVVLDSRGEPTTFKLIWLNTAVIYKFVLKDSTGTTIWTIDNISGDDGTGNTASSVFDQQTLTATAGQTLFTLGYEYVTGTNAMAVYKNGSRLITGTDFTETSSTSVTLTMAAIAGDEYTFIGGQDVSSSFSGTNVSFIQSGTGAVTRSVQTKLRETVSVKDFGAVGDGTTDDTAAIQNAINSLGVNGGIVFFPPGRYIVSDANADNSCLAIQYPIQLVGSGAFYTAIQPAASVAGTVNTITFNPNTGYASDLSSVEKLFIGDPSTGTRTGNHAIYCSTQTALQYLPKFTVRDCSIGQGGGYAIYHLNNGTNNPNGGMYAAVIENNQLRGGIKLENSGDSIVIRNNILSGTGTGVLAALVSGASLLSILDNNITTTNSALIILSGMRVNVLRNNIEHYTVGSNSNAVIDIVASGGTYVGGVIQQNLVSAFGSTDATKLIHIRNARGTLIQDNTFLAGTAGVITGVRVDTTCQDIRIGANSYNAAITTKVNDSGIGTMGVSKTISLLNSWVTQTVADTPTISKDLSGNVIIEGTIKNGTTTPGTQLFVLPVGFRPPTGTVKRFNAYSVGGGGAEFGYFLIDDAGVVTIEDGGNIVFVLSGAKFRASTGADSISPE